jgi:hypothetical protein
VVQKYWAQFPESQHNAYKYFNYDRRVVEESAVRPGSVLQPIPVYKGPEDLTDGDFESLVAHAKTLINPVLAKYSQIVACEDALHLAIHDVENGRFDNKIKANRFNVLLKSMLAPSPAMPVMAADVEAKKRKKEPEPEAPKPRKVSPTTLKRQLGLTPAEVPQRSRIRQRIHAPTLVKEKGQVIIQATEEPNKEGQMLKDAQKYTERLDKVADEVQAFSPEIALQIDMVSDVLEGKREATSLKFDADEARYMANRFDYRVRSRNADEPYMDGYNKSNFEQVITVKKNPVPVQGAAGAAPVAPAVPAAAPAAVPAPEAAAPAPEAPAAPAAPAPVMAAMPYRKVQPE